MNNLRRRVENSSGVVLDPVTGRGVVDGYEVVDLGLSNGLLFATCNVGATRETGYGSYHVYGRGALTYEDSGENPYYGADNPLPLNLDTARQVMGKGWRMPTKDELEVLINETDYMWSRGAKFTSKTNPNAYLFIPAAGRYFNGSLAYTGTYTVIWSSTPNGGNAFILACNKDGARIGYGSRINGNSIRGVHAAV